MARQYDMKLNLVKCVFGMESRKVLGFMVSKRGIEVNPMKIQAILEMKSPRNLHEVQKLKGRIVTLNRFVSRLTN